MIGHNTNLWASLHHATLPLAGVVGVLKPGAKPNTWFGECPSGPVLKPVHVASCVARGRLRGGADGRQLPAWRMLPPT